MRSWIARHPVSFMALYTVFYLTAFHWLEVNITVPAICTRLHKILSTQYPTG